MARWGGNPVPSCHWMIYWMTAARCDVLECVLWLSAPRQYPRGSTRVVVGWGVGLAHSLLGLCRTRVMPLQSVPRSLSVRVFTGEAIYWICTGRAPVFWRKKKKTWILKLSIMSLLAENSFLLTEPVFQVIVLVDGAGFSFILLHKWFITLRLRSYKWKTKVYCKKYSV